MIASQTLLASLSAHPTFDSTEGKHLARCRALLLRHPHDWWRRATAEGHVTASAWVTDAAGKQVLLLHHAKLDRWLQPGGHLDADDDSPSAGALREAREETGLTGLSLLDAQVFDVDVHAIPARGHEAAHLHYDLRFRIVAPAQPVRLSAESLAFRWVDVLSLSGDNIDPGIARMARKTSQLHS